MGEKKYAWTFPHVKGTMSTANLMRMVLAALLPAAVFGVFHFGPEALAHMLVWNLYLRLSRIVRLRSRTAVPR